MIKIIFFFFFLRLQFDDVRQEPPCMIFVDDIVKQRAGGRKFREVDGVL